MHVTTTMTTLASSMLLLLLMLAQWRVDASDLPILQVLEDDSPQTPIPCSRPLPRPLSYRTTPCVALQGLRGVETDPVTGEVTDYGPSTTAAKTQNNNNSKKRTANLIDIVSMVMPAAKGIRIVADPQYVLHGDSDLNMYLWFPCDDPPSDSLRLHVLPCWIDGIDWNNTTPEEVLRVEEPSMVGVGRQARILFPYEPHMPKIVYDGTDDEYQGPTTRLEVFLPEGDAMQRAVALQPTKSYRIDVQRLYWEPVDENGPRDQQGCEAYPSAYYAFEVTEVPWGVDATGNPFQGFEHPKMKKTGEPVRVNDQDYCRSHLRVRWTTPLSAGRSEAHTRSVGWTVRGSQPRPQHHHQQQQQQHQSRPLCASYADGGGGILFGQR